MEDHFQYNDQQFEKAFKTCALHPTLFNHEAHLRLAWIHITKYGIEKAIENIREQLKIFVRHAGAEEKYNETVTVAAIKAVHHFINASTSNNFENFILEFPRLKFHFKQLMAAHYTFDIFTSEQAKREYLKPDQTPFD